MAAFNPNQADETVLEEMERTKWKRVGKELLKDWRLYVLLIPMLVFLACFKYLPIANIVSGFHRGKIGDVTASEWYGLYWAKTIFTGNFAGQFWRAFRNTFVNSMYGLIFGFPIPIFIALLFSEIKCAWYRSILQVLTYLPHFLSTVVVTSIITLWCYEGNGELEYQPGLLFRIFESFGWLKQSELNTNILGTTRFFRPIYQVSGIWQGSGYSSIVYFAAVLAISPTNYEAARIDGASKMQQIRYVTFPGMAPTLTIMLIMRIGQILNIGYEKIILMYRETSWETADVVSSFVYRYSGKQAGYESLASPQMGVIADLMNSLIAMCLVLGANAISRRVSDTTLF